MSKLRTTAEQYMPVYCILVHVEANMEVQAERVEYDVHMPTKLDNFVFLYKTSGQICIVFIFVNCILFSASI